jgi:hypothetical protein
VALREIDTVGGYWTQPSRTANTKEETLCCVGASNQPESGLIHVAQIATLALHAAEFNLRIVH